jgi:DNA-binding transcriptional LysR family regulator
MQWEGISEFVHVAEAGSFTQAAKKLSVSTAHVSRQVTALEKRLNIKLFYRTTRRVSLTQEGDVFYQHCRSVLDGLDAAERAVSNLQSRPQGKIKLTAPVTYAEQKIVPLLNNFLLLHADVQIHANLTNQQLDLVEGGYDIAIRLGKLADSSLMAKKLSNRRSYICASPAYIESYGTPHTLGELASHNCLLGTLDHWRFTEGGRQRLLRVSGTLTCNSGSGLLDAALKGLGLVQLPDYYVHPHIENGTLVSVLDDYAETGEGVWAVYPHNRHLSPRIRLLVDYLAENLE